MLKNCKINENIFKTVLKELTRVKIKVTFFFRKIFFSLLDFQLAVTFQIEMPNAEYYETHSTQ